MIKLKFTVRKIAFAAVIAAVYAALTIVLAPISYGPIQFRISEALCILPFFFPAATWGLFAGCVIANLYSAYGLIDIVCGSLATLIAALATMRLGKVNRESAAVKALACLPPVISNGIIIGIVLALSITPEAPLLVSAATFGGQVALGELVVMYVIGFPLMLALPKMRVYKTLREMYDN